MLPLNSNRRAFKRGFTLLEMLAVIVLLGIVGVIVARSVSGRVDTGKWDAGKIGVTKLDQDVQAYALDNGSPPKSPDDLVTKPLNAPSWNGPYAKPADLNDPFGHPYGYVYPGKHGQYDIIFYGRDGKPGGEASTVTTATGNSGEMVPGRLSPRPVSREMVSGTFSRRPAWRGSPRSKMSLTPFRGFTLIEMLAVIVLIAIAATVAAVSLHGRSRGELQAAAQRVAAGLRDTRTRAMATGKPQWFSVDVRAHAYTVPGREPRGLPADATVDVQSAA